MRLAKTHVISLYLLLRIHFFRRFSQIDQNTFLNSNSKTFLLQAAKRKALFEEHLPKGLKVYEEKFVPRDGFFLGDDVSKGDMKRAFWPDQESKYL